MSVKTVQGEQSELHSAHDGVLRASSRERKHTEKGLHYEMETLERSFKLVVSRWRSCVGKITVLLSDETEIDSIRFGRDQLESTSTEVKTVFSRLTELFDPNDPKIQGFTTVFEEIEVDYQNLMCKVADRILELQTVCSANSQQSYKRSSLSGKSSRSRSSVGSKRCDAVAQVAVLKAKLRYIDAESKAQVELDRLVTQRKIEMAQAKVDALDSISSEAPSIAESHNALDIPKLDKWEYVKDYVQNNVPTNVDQIIVKKHIAFNADSSPVDQGHEPEPPLSPHADVFMPLQYRLSTGDQLSSPANDAVKPSADNGILELTKSLSEQLALSRLPPPEPGIFDGDPLKYPGWKSAFHTLIEQKCIPASEKIHYLRKYLADGVREVVSNFFLIGTGDAYEEAKQLLDQRFGDSFVVSNAFRDKLDKWPKVQSKDALGLRKLADFLQQCHTAMTSIGYLGALDDERENRKVLGKLPEWLSARWNRIAVQWREEKNASPPFKEFVKFLTKEAKIACDPVTSVQSLKTDQSFAGEKKVEYARFERKNFRKAGSFMSEVSGKPVANVLKLECGFCKKGHDIDNCDEFMARSVESRKLWVRKAGLCFGCLKGNHMAKSCKQRKKCKICNQLHPTSLHGDRCENGKGSVTPDHNPVPPEVNRKGDATPSTSLMSHACSGRLSSMIVPVYVSHESCPENERLVYALLDSQSDTTFILNETCDAIGVSGVDVSLSLSTMYAKNKLIQSKKVKGLQIRGLGDLTYLSLPATYTRQIMPVDRSHIPSPQTAESWPHLKSIASEIPPIQNCEVGLLIGYNCTRAHIPREVIAPDFDGPYAQRTDLGWGIVGIVDHECALKNDCDQIGVSHKVVVCEVGSSLLSNEDIQVDHVAFAFRSKVKEVFSPTDVVKMMNLEFSERVDDSVSLSVEDQRFIDIVGTGVQRKEGHYEMPLPLRTENVCLPHNKSLAAQRLNHLRRRLKGDETFRDHYCSFMNDMIEKGYAERVPDDSLNRNDGRVFYIPHHGVYNPNKPGKIRVVFDCSAQFKGESLNKHLLQGPDLTNTLIGVLCRFRKERVAVLCDIEQMFFQFRVGSNDRDLLRFLWWENNDFESEPSEFRMCVHLFGASSSPGCANFGLKQIAADYEKEFGPDVAKFVRRDFYVDDGLTSKPSEEEAMRLVVQSKHMLSKGGLRLHKFLSSSKPLLQQLPPEDLAKSFMEIDLLSDSLPIERALGVQWAIESDSFQFKITLSDKPLTRRGILSTVNSVYDPLGFISPVILVGKQILQHLCADQLDWDSPIPESLRAKWEFWRYELLQLAALEIDRCFKPEGFGKVTSTELHHFSDASQYGYGQCSYLRLVDERQQVHCSLVIGKSRVAPLKPITIPRLELTAAVVSVKIGTLIQQELEFDNVESCYWTDSKVVLGYINNEARRFHVYVANRVQQIRDRTNTSQWRYVETNDNPADIASRGVSAGELIKGSAWFSGPKFLWKPVLPDPKDVSELSNDDCELRKVHTLDTRTEVVSNQLGISSSFQYFSSWSRLRKVVALCLKFIRILKGRVSKRAEGHVKGIKSDTTKDPDLKVEHLIDAERSVIRVVQLEAFRSEVETLKRNQKCENSQKGLRKSVLKGSSALAGLDPFLDGEGILRVGGRLKRSRLDLGEKNPIILPKRGHITDLIIRHFHESVIHQGRGMTVNAIRAYGFWILSLSSAVYQIVSKCVSCRRFRSAPRGQKMADLPVDRLESVPPFTYTGVDYFGPWLVREGRKEMKRYGVIFTCLCCRAIHLEIATSLTTDSFINALRRFMSIRGPVRELRSDRGTNFVGAERELASAVSEMDEEKIHEFLLDRGCDNLLFKMNPPHASHMGGVWERQIRSVRNVLSLLLHQHGVQLDDESLRTLMCEAAAIVNSRPLTTQNLSDPLSPEPLTPNHLLTMKSKVVLPPPGSFQREDLYSRKYWRRVQYLADQFWSRWRKEYLQILQIRKKWSRPVRNCMVGDVVLVIDDSLPRNQWPLARVDEACADEDGLVRRVKLSMATRYLDKQGKRHESLSKLERPIHKLVLIRETERIPDGEP